MAMKKMFNENAINPMNGGRLSTEIIESSR